jgi:hypothetical protein
VTNDRTCKNRQLAQIPAPGRAPGRGDEENRRKENLINPRGNRYLVSVSQSPSPHVSLDLSHDRREFRFDRSWGNTEIGKGECRITHDIIPSHEYHLISCKGWVWQEPEEGSLDLPDEERHRNQNPPSLQVHEDQRDELPVAVHPRPTEFVDLSLGPGRAHRLHDRFRDIPNKHRLEPCRAVTEKGEDG